MSSYDKHLTRVQVEVDGYAWRVHGAKDVRCVCDPDKESGLQSPAITAPELGACWHGVGTTVLRVFEDGGLLLKNRGGYVRGARPDEVCR